MKQELTEKVYSLFREQTLLFLENLDTGPPLTLLDIKILGWQIAYFLVGLSSKGEIGNSGYFQVEEIDDVIVLSKYKGQNIIYFCGKKRIFVD